MTFFRPRRRAACGPLVVGRADNRDGAAGAVNEGCRVCNTSPPGRPARLSPVAGRRSPGRGHLPPRRRRVGPGARSMKAEKFAAAANQTSLGAHLAPASGPQGRGMRADTHPLHGAGSCAQLFRPAAGVKYRCPTTRRAGVLAGLAGGGLARSLPITACLAVFETGRPVVFV